MSSFFLSVISKPRCYFLSKLFNLFANKISSETRVKTTNKCDDFKQKWFRDGRYMRNETEFCRIMYTTCAFPKETRKHKRPQETLCRSPGKHMYVCRTRKSYQIKCDLLAKSCNNTGRSLGTDHIEFVGFFSISFNTFADRIAFVNSAT